MDASSLPKIEQKRRFVTRCKQKAVSFKIGPFTTILERAPVNSGFGGFVKLLTLEIIL